MLPLIFTLAFAIVCNAKGGGGRGGGGFGGGRGVSGARGSVGRGGGYGRGAGIGGRTAGSVASGIRGGATVRRGSSSLIFISGFGGQHILHRGQGYTYDDIKYYFDSPPAITNKSEICSKIISTDGNFMHFRIQETDNRPQTIYWVCKKEMCNTNGFDCLTPLW